MQVHMATKRKKLMPKDPEDLALEMAIKAGLTPERFRKAGSDYDVGDDGQGRKTLTMRDAPLERALSRGAVNREQYNAGVKYRHHWFHAGLSDSMGHLDFGGVFGRDAGSFSGMCKTEQQVFHRQRYRSAVQVVGKVGSRVLDEVVARETSLEQMGYLLGWGSKPQAITAATVHLQLALDALVREWGM